MLTGKWEDLTLGYQSQGQTTKRDFPSKAQEREEHIISDNYPPLTVTFRVLGELQSDSGDLGGGWRGSTQ